MPSAQRDIFEKEIEALSDRVGRVKYRLEEERELLRRMIEANIWLSTLDRNETLLLHDSRSTELAELDMLISKSWSMLGLQNRQIQSKQQLAKVPESKKFETKNPEEKSSEAKSPEAIPESKAPLSESGGTVNSFMRGIGSRLRLK